MALAVKVICSFGQYEPDTFVKAALGLLLELKVFNDVATQPEAFVAETVMV